MHNSSGDKRHRFIDFMTSNTIPLNLAYANFEHWHPLVLVIIVSLLLALAIVMKKIPSAPGQRHAIIWTNAWILLMRTSWTMLSEILSVLFFQEYAFEMSSAKWQQFCLGLNQLNHFSTLFSWLILSWVLQNKRLCITYLDDLIWMPQHNYVILCKMWRCHECIQYDWKSVVPCTFTMECFSKAKKSVKASIFAANRKMEECDFRCLL